MNIKHLIPLMLLPLSGCVGLLIPPALEVGDRMVNTVSGGDAGATISGNAGFNRYKGSEDAEGWCVAYQVVTPYDVVRFTPTDWEILGKCTGEGKAEPNDHCTRWYWKDYGVLNELKKRYEETGEITCDHADRYDEQEGEK